MALVSSCLNGQNLQAWCRPLDEQCNQVLLSNFTAYRHEHKFLQLTCLCNLLGDSMELSTWLNETVVEMHSVREFAGEYMASCHLEHCGYKSEFLTRTE